MATSPKSGADEVLNALREATQGLLYMSESDEPFAVVHWKGDGKSLDSKKLLALSGHKPGAPVQAVLLDDFFKDLTTERDWYGKEEKEDVQRYRHLLTVIKANLPEAKVFRIGKINVDLYIVGQTRDGDWVGVKTAAVET